MRSYTNMLISKHIERSTEQFSDVENNVFNIAIHLIHYSSCITYCAGQHKNPSGITLLLKIILIVIVVVIYQLMHIFVTFPLMLYIYINIYINV